MSRNKVWSFSYSSSQVVNTSKQATMIYRELHVQPCKQTVYIMRVHVVPDTCNIHTQGWGTQKPKFFKESMKLNWNFQRVGGWGVLENKKPSMGVWILIPGTTRCINFYQERKGAQNRKSTMNCSYLFKFFVGDVHQPSGSQNLTNK